MKKQILSVTLSIAILSITPALADSSSDDHDSNLSRNSTKKKSHSSNVKKKNSKKKGVSHLNSKQDSKDNRVQHNNPKIKGQSTHSIFTAQTFTAELSGEGSPAYSIPTTDSPADITTTPSGEEILTPKPRVVKKNKSTRQAKHAAAFEKSSGHKSATTYIKENNGDIDAPQIGHAQGYQNHGSLADTRKNNLAVISQTTNLKMNIADRKYQNGDVDANSFIVEEGTLIAKYALQQNANPSNHSLLTTPTIVLPANMEKLSTEKNQELKKDIARAFDPERKKAIEKAQKKNPEDFPTIEEHTKKIQKKIKEYEAKGKEPPYPIKFSDQSRENRNKTDQKEKDKKNKKDKR